MLKYSYCNTETILHFIAVKVTEIATPNNMALSGLHSASTAGWWCEFGQVSYSPLGRKRDVDIYTLGCLGSVL